MNRPYFSFKDFLNKTNFNKTVILSLIKGGAFDEIEVNGFNSRKMIMGYYLYSIGNLKKKLTLQNFNGLVQNDLIPKELEMQMRIFNFNKYLKGNKKVGKYYTFDDICLEFFNRFYGSKADIIQIVNEVPCTLQADWDKIYKSEMGVAREWLKENQVSMLRDYNQLLFNQEWKKYAKGTLSTWEMAALGFYHSEHELSHIDVNRYGISNFYSLNPTSEVDYYFKRKKADIPIYKLSRIMGTVISKMDTKSTVIIMTTTGVVSVKFSKDYYAMFKKQISEILPSGAKKVKEKGWFTRGTMLIITGFRRGDSFVGKTYKATKSHQIYKITEIVDNELKIQHERWTAVEGD